MFFNFSDIKSKKKMATHDCNFAIFLSIQTKNAEMNIQIHVLQLFDGQQQQQKK